MCFFPAGGFGINIEEKIFHKIISDWMLTLLEVSDIINKLSQEKRHKCLKYFKKVIDKTTHK